MKILDLLGGVVVGIVGYYLLSLASAYWIAQVRPSDYIVSILICVFTAIVIGAFTCIRPQSSIPTVATMIALVIIAIAIGSNENVYAEPLAFEFPMVFLHGGRTPLVAVVPALLLGGLVMNRVRRIRAERFAQVRSENSMAGN